MHDLDHAPGLDAFDAREHEESPAGAHEAEDDFGSARREGLLGEAEELALAAELLAVSSEEELDRFLGNLIRRAGRAVGTLVRRPIRRALRRVLKQAAKKALRAVGEERELEAALRFVRLAVEATMHAVEGRPTEPPGDVDLHGIGRSGRWVRRGRHIILLEA